MKDFLDQNFLLETKTAQTLFHDFAAGLPIIDYHCHLPPDQIAADSNFENLTQIWLYGDHYKWRAMRANGIPEKYITGNASDWEKFENGLKQFPLLSGTLFITGHILNCSVILISTKFFRLQLQEKFMMNAVQNFRHRSSQFEG
jgi:glucuronate isomerase